MSLRDDLIAAKALIDTPEKWGKGTGGYRGPARPLLCAYGACYEAHGSEPRFFAASYALDHALPDGWDRDDALATAIFNDAPSTTHADIMALFDRAIAAASDA